MATLLSIITDLCGRQNLPIPTTVYGTSDPQIRQLMRLLEEEGNDLSSRTQWERLINEASLTTLAAEDQGAITSIAANGFRFIIGETIWDRSNKLPVCGPHNSRTWQAMKALVSTGPRYTYRIRGGKFLVNPTPEAGLTWYFEYLSKNWISDSGGSSFYARFTADTNIILLPEDLCLQGLRWRWKKEKGLDYAEDFRTYETQVADAIGRDASKPILNMNGETEGLKPGIWVNPYSSVQ